jgi:hypothetical protein
MEDAVASRKLLPKSTPSVEFDVRARDARNCVAQMERLLVPRAVMPGAWLSPFVRLLGSRSYGSWRSDARERGGVGARSLNIELQSALNSPGDDRIERFGWTFCSGDKVMQIENREVYNGDLAVAVKGTQARRR